MGWVKRLGASPRLRAALCWAGAQYIRFVRASGPWQTMGAETPERYWREGKGFILAFWHGRLLMMAHCWRRSVPMHMLISQHRDGEFIAETIRHFGLGTVRGSTKKGGGAALRTMVRALKAGECVGITPDGPRGPRMRAGIGAISLARLSGAPIIPAAYAASRRTLLSSWDRFVLALPFSRGVILWGEPITVPREADAAAEEAARAALEAQLNALTEKADRLVGQTPIAPEPTREAARAL